MATCLNCTRLALANEDFCQPCLDRVETMVDNSELKDQEAVNMSTNLNPFFSSNRMAGGLENREGTVSGQVDEDEDDGSYWSAIVLISLILALMLIVFL